jgi:hypothetical protein
LSSQQSGSCRRKNCAGPAFSQSADLCPSPCPNRSIAAAASFAQAAPHSDFAPPQAIGTQRWSGPILARMIDHQQHRETAPRYGCETGTAIDCPQEIRLNYLIFGYFGLIYYND